MWQDLLLTLGAGIVVSWLTLLIALLLARPKGPMLAEAMRLMPDLLRLLRRLAADRNLPRGVHARLVLLLVYLALPVDLVPDFVPVVGYADDAIIVAAVLRAVVRRAGIEAVRAHWPGTDSGFAALARLTGLHAAGAGTSARMRSPDSSQGAQVPSCRCSCRGRPRSGARAPRSAVISPHGCWRRRCSWSGACLPGPTGRSWKPGAPPTAFIPKPSRTPAAPSASSRPEPGP